MILTKLLRRLRAAAMMLGLTAAAVCAPVRAQLDVRVDLSNFQGTTAGNWNNVSNLTGVTANLIDFNTGAGTGVSIDGVGSPWTDFFGDDGGTFPDQDWLVQPATVDGAGLQSDLTGVFRVSGLAGAAYQVEVVSARNDFGYLNTVTVGGSLADRTFLGSPVNTPWNATTDGLVPGNWLIWDNVAPVGGAITIQDVSGPGTLGILNAVRILEVPEPTSCFLLLISVAAIAMLTKRRI